MHLASIRYGGLVTRRVAPTRVVLPIPEQDDEAATSVTVEGQEGHTHFLNHEHPARLR